MRNISLDGLTKLANKTGIEPVTIIEIQWVDGVSTKYSTKQLDGITGLILEISSIDDIIKLDVGGNSTSLDVTLSDADGHLKEIIDRIDINKRPCIIHQWFTGLAYSDAFELFRGEIYSPIVWDEGTRRLSFTILSQIQSREVGFAPEEGQFKGIPEEYIGQVWPLGFGTPIHVPAVKAFDEIRGTALSLGGFPDHTLPLKKELLQHRIEQVKDGYNYYQQMITKAQDMELVGQQLQEEYAYHQVGYFNTRQTIADLTEAVENLNKQLQVLTKDYEEPSSDTPRTTLDDQIDTLKTTIQKYINSLTGLYENLDHFKRREEEYRTRTKILKFKVNFINKLKKKCQDLLRDYGNFTNQVTIINEFIKRQNLLTLQAVYITQANKFQQNSNIRLFSKNVYFTGRVANGAVDMIVPIPNYTRGNLVTTARESQAVDTFWLADSNTNIENMYIYTEKGYIAKVTQQEDNKCIITLPVKTNKYRQQKRRIDYSNDEDTKTLFDDTLSRLLTGVETEEQIADVANTIPKFINPRVMQILTGENKQFRIEMTKTHPKMSNYNLKNAESGGKVTFFSVKYEGNFKQTNLLSPSMSATEIKNELEALAPWLVDKITVSTGSSITQQGQDFFEYYLVDIPDALPHRFTLTNYGFGNKANEAINQSSFATIKYVNDVEISASYTIDTAGMDIDYIGGDIYQVDIYLNGYLVTILSAEDSASEIEGKLITAIDDLNLDLDVTVIGESIISGGTITITLSGDDRASILIRPYNLTYPQDQLNNKNVKGIPKIVVQYSGLPISRYTEQEINNLIIGEMNKSPVGNAYIAAQEVIQDLLLTKKTQIVNGLTDKEIDDALSAAYQQLNSILYEPSYRATKFYVENIYDDFPEGVYKTLYEQELLGFLEFVNELRPLDVEIEPGQEYEFTALNMGDILEASPIILPKWLEYTNNTENEIDRYKRIEALPNSTEPFYINVGDLVTLADAFQEKWIANILPSTIKSIYAYKNMDGLNRFMPVPSSYYSKNENDDFGEYHCTTVTLVKPLKTIDPTWEDQLYVTYESSIGPNVVDVIEWMINKYSTLTIDNDTFDHVRTLQINYPVNFALFDKQDLISLIQNIAWQARCMVWVNGNTVYLRYLSEEPTSVATITEADIEQNSLQLTFTQTELIATKYIANWQPTYLVDKPYKIVVRRNLGKYNEISEENDFFIYNNRDLVYKSLTFWLIRKANTWRRVSMKLFLNKLMIETNDCITLNLSSNFITNGSIKCLVENAQYDSINNSLTLECWLPVLSNEKTKYIFAWPKDLTISDVFPTYEDVVSGNAGNPLNIGVPDGTNYQAIDPSILDDRPDDFGSKNIYDGDDDIPPSLANLTEKDYKIRNAEQFLMDVGIEDTIENEITLDASTQQGSDDIVPIQSATIVSYNNDISLPDTTPGEEVLGGNTNIDVPNGYLKLMLNNGKIIYAKPMFNRNNDVTLSQNEQVLVFRGEQGEYRYYTPDNIGPLHGVV